MPAPLRRKPPTLLERDPSDPFRRAVELAQRGRMILDVSTADLEASEAALGPFHPTSWHFRNALNEAKRSWDRLRAEFGGSALEAALNEPPIAVLTLGDDGRGGARMTLIPIAGRTYRAQRVDGTPLAPIQWRLTRLTPPHDSDPYFACRLHDGSTQCDCAEWTYQIAETGHPHPHNASCKHLAALAALGWI